MAESDGGKRMRRHPIERRASDGFRLHLPQSRVGHRTLRRYEGVLVRRATRL
jgi:hypothetical protein